MSPELSAGVVLLAFGALLVFVAAASDKTEVKRWVTVVIPPPVQEARKPLGALGVALLVAGAVLVVLAYLGDDDPGRPDPFTACAAALRATAAEPGADRAAEVLPSVAVARGPVDVVATGAGIFVAHADGRVTRIPRVDSPPAVQPLAGVQVGTSRTTNQVAIAAGLTRIWVVKSEGTRGVVAKLPRNGGRILRERALDQPDDVAVGGGSVWVTTDNAKLFELDPEDLATRKEIELDGDPHGVLAHPPCLYVATTGDPNGFVAFDMRSGRKIGDYPAGGGGEVAAGAGALWLTDREGEPAILRVEPGSPRRATSKPLTVTPAYDALAVGARGAWTAGGASTVIRTDRSGTERQRIALDGEPVSISVDEASHVVWVARRASARVTPIRP